jgi:pSer/pThr/pTyr-binding forkhead associated (FHA) protein
MNGAIAIQVITGPHKNQRFTFERPVRFSVGRADDCLIRLSGDERDLKVSRRHCEFRIDPPRVLLRDLGSLNGTYLNGKRLEPAQVQPTTAGHLRTKEPAETPVSDGDVVTLGGMSFQVNLIDTPAPA